MNTNKTGWRLPLRAEGSTILDANGMEIAKTAISRFSTTEDHAHIVAFVKAVNGMAGATQRPEDHLTQSDDLAHARVLIRRLLDVIEVLNTNGGTLSVYADAHAWLAWMERDGAGRNE
jgi:hypothetical protein